jgi:hypothetical protein
MPLKLCPRCTIIDEDSERSHSPELPSSRAVKGQPTDPQDPLPDEALATCSRHSSIITEDLRNIQRIFEDANTAEVNQDQARDSDSLKNSPRKSIIGSLFRKTLMRTRSKSVGMLLTHMDQLERNKNELRKTLCTGQGRDAGGYDSDAAVLDEVDTPVTLQASNTSPERSRGKIRLDGERPPK